MMEYLDLQKERGFFMGRKYFTPEQIIKRLCETEVLLSKEETIGPVVRKFGDYRCNVLPLAKGIRREYNRVRPHSSLGYRPPAPETKLFGYFLENPTLEVVK